MATFVRRPNHPKADALGMVDKAEICDESVSTPHSLYVISDDLGKGLMHHGTGKVTDSKSHFRRMTRDSGCIEYGDQTPKAERPKINRADLKNDIGRAVYELKNGRRL